jgi:hypothetical protein
MRTADRRLSLLRVDSARNLQQLNTAQPSRHNRASCDLGSRHFVERKDGKDMVRRATDFDTDASPSDDETDFGF